MSISALDKSLLATSMEWSIRSWFHFFISEHKLFNLAWGDLPDRPICFFKCAKSKEIPIIYWLVN
jgi:hypothetical protein